MVVFIVKKGIVAKGTHGKSEKTAMIIVSAYESRPVPELTEPR
jgi:hypothetical protein